MKRKNEGKIFLFICMMILNWLLGFLCFDLLLNLAIEVADVCDTGKEPKKKQKTEGAMQILTGNEGFRLNITESDSVDAAAFDLEELIVRIEWLKRLLTPDVGDGSYWEYEDYCPSST